MVFGTSERLVESAAIALEGKTFTPKDNLCSSLKAATEVASCRYEYGTAWGNQVGNKECTFKGNKLAYMKMISHFVKIK